MFGRAEGLLGPLATILFNTKAMKDWNEDYLLVARSP